MEQLVSIGWRVLLNETRTDRPTPDTTLIDQEQNPQDSRYRRPLEIKAINYDGDDFSEVLAAKFEKAGRQIANGCNALKNWVAARQENGLRGESGGIIRLIIRAHNNRPEDWEHDILPQVTAVRDALEEKSALDAVDGIWIVVESRDPNGRLVQLAIGTPYRDQTTGAWGDGSDFMDRLLTKWGVHRDIVPPFSFPT